jgi:hypothetical protein
MGRDPIIASIANCILGTLTIFVIYRLQKDFFEVKSTVLTVLLLCFYPSFVVWAATNIRDPLYFFISASFIYTFLTIFSVKKKTPIEFRLAGIPLCALFYLLIIGLRSYAGSIFLGSFAVAFLFYFMTKKMKPKFVIPLILGIGLFIAMAAQLFAPDFLNSSLRELEKTRDAFGNLKLLDFVAKSSFALDQTFTDIFDVLVFLPNSLTHYFFGPFPWEIDSTMQQVAFIEALFVYVLTYPTIIGIKRFYERSRFETVVILVFVTFVVLAQATVISNMGTIFRHRSLSFMFLLMFTGEGLYELGKKYLPTIFAPERGGTSDSRRKSFFGIRPFWV